MNLSPFTKGSHGKGHLSFAPFFCSLTPVRVQMDLEILVNKTISFLTWTSKFQILAQVRPSLQSGGQFRSLLEVLCLTTICSVHLNHYWEYIYWEDCLLLHEKNIQHKSPIPRKKNMDMSLLLGITFITYCFIQAPLPPACAIIRAHDCLNSGEFTFFLEVFLKIREGRYHRFLLMLFV